MNFGLNFKLSPKVMFKNNMVVIFGRHFWTISWTVVRQIFGMSDIFFGISGNFFFGISHFFIGYKKYGSSGVIYVFKGFVYSPMSMCAIKVNIIIM